MSFQIYALPAEKFQHLFALSDAELSQHHARRMLATVNPGFPCRISLEDAAIGEEVILANFEHQPGASPYRASHAIFVRPGVAQATPGAGEIPESISLRLMSVRAFDENHNIVDADVVKGRDLEASIDAMFENNAVAYLHLHNAKPGCYAAKVTRA